MVFVPFPFCAVLSPKKTFWYKWSFSVYRPTYYVHGCVMCVIIVFLLPQLSTCSQSINMHNGWVQGFCFQYHHRRTLNRKLKCEHRKENPFKNQCRLIVDFHAEKHFLWFLRCCTVASLVQCSIQLLKLLCPPLIARDLLHYYLKTDSSQTQCQRTQCWGEQSVSEDLEPFEQSECGSPSFALSSGRLHCNQLGGGRGRQLLVAWSYDWRDTKQRFVLADIDSPGQTAPLTLSLRSPHCLIEDVLHRVEVPTGWHLEERTAKTSGQGLTITLTHLSERINQLLNVF